MNNLIFSLSSVLGVPVYSTKGVAIAVVYDLVCNKDTGRITYFILCSDAPRPDNAPADLEYFAIHHSYLYFAGGERRQLTFSPKLGNEEQSYFIELPEQYEDIEVQTLTDFSAYLYLNTHTAGHRSDND
ncbi:PRC-barrel domain-containing protein [Lewinella sp. IMCC34183]|uniref:PRC-barrel domain-containing protein n=1 Tax=Lewinella sp. IMCC34183 TaxID=2248762 RepID=UPI000E26C428|nr:PRC-barrel domain-containing protein [Lewinella sp. IMCC34183]